LSSFHIGKYEVTQEEWEAVMGSNPSHFKGCPKCPVEQVSWDDIQEFLQKLNTKTANNYRLPTEAEWEYAARGGKRSKGYKYSGANNNLSSVGWYNRNSNDKTREVGTKRSNELGLFDMSGNVYEWCSDWYDTGYYAKSPKMNPTGPSSGKSKVFRGGAWYFIDWIYGGTKRNSYDSSERRKYGVGIHRVSYRNGYVPSFRFYFIGFRLCRT
jgi:formylglycine-generating enzyme required for sulfatase activity